MCCSAGVGVQRGRLSDSAYTAIAALASFTVACASRHRCLADPWP